MVTKKKASPATTSKVPRADIASVLPYKVDDFVTFTSRDGKPESIHKVVSVHKTHAMVTGFKSSTVPIKIHYNDPDVRATLPADGAAIRLRMLKRSVADLGEDSLDSEALAAIAPIVASWQGRKARRMRRLKASLRVALISGEPMQASNLSIKGYPYIDGIELDGLLDGIGAVDVSVGMGRRYQRAPTREDYIDAVVLREACPPKGCEFVELMRAVGAAVPTDEGTPLQKEVIDAAERCGRMPGRDNPVVLQSWDGEVSSGLVITP